MNQFMQKTLLALSTTLLFTSGAQAANWTTCNGNIQRWTNNWTNMYLSTISFPPGSDWDSHTQYMMSEWNAVAGSSFRYYYGRDTDGTYNKSNGVNEIYFENNPNDTYLGITWSRTNCSGSQYGYVEADIGINTRYAWTLSPFTGTATGSPYNFDLVMLHELGHAFGLKHSDGKIATLNTYYFNGGPNGYYNTVQAHGDDRYGVRILYPTASTSQHELSASKFKNDGGGGSQLNSTSTSVMYRGNTYAMNYIVKK